MSAVNTINLVKRGDVWVPVGTHAQEYTAKFKDGEEVLFKRQKAKSPKEMRWYFAMLRKVIDNTERFTNTEELREALLIGTGNYTWHRDMYGRLREVPDSMADMDEDQFREHKKEALKLIETELGIDATELMREVDGTEKVYGRYFK